MSIATACRIQSAVRSLHARRSVTIAHEPVSTAMVWLSGVGSGSSSNTRTVVSCVCHGASSVQTSSAADRHAPGEWPSAACRSGPAVIGYVSPFLLAPGHVPVKHYAAGKTMGQITNIYERCACGISPVAYWASALSRCGTSAAAEDACCGTKIWSRMARAVGPATTPSPPPFSRISAIATFGC